MLDRTLRSRAFWLSLIAGAFVINGIWLYRNPINGDIAFYATAGQRLNEGARLYTDIHDPNFPLPYILNQVLAAISSAFHLYPPVTVFAAFWVLVAAALSSLYFALRRTSTFESPYLWLAILLTAQSALFLNRYDFGQRDVAAGIGALILVSNAFLLLCGQPLAAPRRYPLLFLAALTLALKPHFLAGWLLVILMLAVRTTFARALRAPEFWMAPLVSGIHWLLTAIFYPNYWSDAKLVLNVYSAYNAPLGTLLFDVRFVILVGAIAFLWKADRRVQDVARLSALGALGFAVAAIQQGKQWGYHFTPAYFLAWVTVAILCVDLLRPRANTVVLAVALFVGLWPVAREIRTAPAPLDPVQQFAIEKGRNAWILPLSTDLWTGYPLILDADAKSALPESVLWMVPGFYIDQIRAAKQWTPAQFHTPTNMNSEEKRMFEELVEAVQRYRPAVIVVQTPGAQQGMGKLQFDFLKYFSMDDRFRAVLANYAEGPSDSKRQVLYLRTR